MTDPVETLARALHGPWYDIAPEKHKEISRRDARAFIAAIVAEAVKAEREECAKLGEFTDDCPMGRKERSAVSAYAAAIRARTP